MKCWNCQHENTAEANFCEECAAPLLRLCANCKSQVSSTAKFCPQCGQSLIRAAGDPRFASPKIYTPRHLADKILTFGTKAHHRAVRGHQGVDGINCLS